MRWRTMVLGLLAVIGAIPAARGAEAGWFPFVLPWDDDSRTAVHVGALLPTPAGGDGFLQARDGHLVDGKGRRVRLLGVNFVFGANFPNKPDAAKLAARMRKFGINIVRLHHMDFYHAPRGIFDPAYRDNQHLDKEQLDRLDYLVHQLKEHGIYVNVNLHVSRHLNAADGFPDTDSLPRLGKAVGYYEPRMIELQKKYAKDLLDRVNPYTKTRYTDEPAVAVIELTNEDTLLGEAWGSTLSTLPARYRAELTRQWNAWLKERYGSTAALRTAWKATATVASKELLTSGVKNWHLEQHQGAKAALQAVAAADRPEGVPGPVLKVALDRLGQASWHVQLNQSGLRLRDGQLYTVAFHARADRKRPVSVSASIAADDWHNIGLQEEAILDREWRSFRFVFTAADTLPERNRLVFGLGQAGGTVELAGVSLRPGAVGALAPDASVEKGTVPPARPSASPTGQDWIAFLIDVEKRYTVGLKEYIQNDLKSKSLVLCSQASYGGLGGALRERSADFTDMHSYWQHPHFPRRPWDANDWRIDNTAMVRHKSAGTMPGLAHYRLAGRAFTVSEYNHPAPNDYQAECVPLLAAFAAWQDWDGVYLFDYTGDRDHLTDTRIRGFFSIDSNPAKMALMPAAALLFHRGDLAPAAATAELRVPTGSVPALLGRYGPNIARLWSAAGSPPEEVLTHRLALAFVDGTGAPTLNRQGKPADNPPLRLIGAGTDKALLTVDAPASKLLVGALAGRSVDVGGPTVAVPADGPAFAVVALSALDGQATAKSRSLLLTAVGRVENEGMGWNETRTSVGNRWGKGPARAQGIPATVTLPTGGKTVTVHALDGTGKRAGRVPVTMADGKATFAIGPSHRTLWYEIAVDAE